MKNTRRLSTPDKYKDVRSISPAERMRKFFINADGVLKMAPISRSALWAKVNSGDFPAPYHIKRAAFWDQSEVEDYLAKLINSSNVGNKKDVRSITWDQVKALVKRDGGWMTNKDIAYILDCEIQDARVLTRLMANAGELESYIDGPAHGSPIKYKAVNP